MITVKRGTGDIYFMSYEGEERVVGRTLGDAFRWLATKPDIPFPWL